MAATSIEASTNALSVPPSRASVPSVPCVSFSVASSPQIEYFNASLMAAFELSSYRLQLFHLRVLRSSSCWGRSKLLPAQFKYLSFAARTTSYYTSHGQPVYGSC